MMRRHPMVICGGEVGKMLLYKYHGRKEEIQMGGHHLILGKLTDFITSEQLDDTLDERYRQKIARYLVNEKGYLRSDLIPKKELIVQAGDNRAVIRIDLVVTMNGKTAMVIKYGPGSLVTRRRPALACARLLASGDVPVVVVSNGEDAEVMDGKSGQVMGTGFDAIPSRARLSGLLKNFGWRSISPDRKQMESRIAYAYEVDDSCPCDDTVCKL